MIDQVVILCGGRGSRLGALTKETAKPMLEFQGRPFLDFLIKKYIRFPIKEILLLAGFQGEDIYLRYHNKVMNGVILKVIIEPKSLGTFGAVLGSFDFLATEFLLTNGDSYLECDFWDVFEWWNSSEIACSAGIVVGDVADTTRYGQISVNNGKVVSLSEKKLDGNGGLINLGVYVIQKKILKQFLNTEYAVSSLEIDFLPRLASAQTLRYFKVDNHSLIDFGVPEDLKRLQLRMSKFTKDRAVFFDRDNTINYDAGYTHKLKDLVLCNGIIDTMKNFIAAGYKLFIVSNQSGVGRGYYLESDVISFHNELKKKLSRHNVFINDFRFCPHHPSEAVGAYKKICNCRKPETGMVLDLCETWNLDLSSSLFYGDSESDRVCAERLNVTFTEVNCEIESADQ